MMEKIKAFLVHFLLSGIVILGFVSLIWFVWYPAPFLKAEGGQEIILIVIGVQLILGPILTAVVYKKGKKELFFDLSLIVLVQLIALLYGMYTLYTERPQYVAFVVDRFTLVPAVSIDTDELSDKNLRTTMFDKPRFVFIELEKDADVRFSILMETIYGGKGYSERPRYYRNISEHLDTIRNDHRQLKLETILKVYPEVDKTIHKLAATNGRSLDQLIFYPLKGKQKFMILVLDRSDLTVLAGLDVDPWPVYKR